MAQQTGTIAWLNDAKGFGFITCEDGTDVFINPSASQADVFKSLSKGDRVSFNITTGTTGRPWAADVARAE